MIAGLVEPGSMPVGFDESDDRAARGTCILGYGCPESGRLNWRDRTQDTCAVAMLAYEYL